MFRPAIAVASIVRNPRRRPFVQRLIQESTIMCDGIHIKSPDGSTFCLPIYAYQIAWPPNPPDPDRFREVFDDINTIATISQAISRLHNHDVRGLVTEAMQASLKTVAHHLPAGATLGNGLLKLPQRG